MRNKEGSVKQNKRKIDKGGEWGGGEKEREGRERDKEIQSRKRGGEKAR